MSFVVRYRRSARDDLARLYEHLLERATTAEDLDLAERALEAITCAVESAEALAVHLPQGRRRSLPA